MVTFDEKKYNSLKSDDSTIILTKYGTYRVKLKDSPNQYFLSVYKNTFTVNSKSYQIYFHLDLPILENQDRKEEQKQIDFLRTLFIEDEDTVILIDNGSFKNSYSYNFKLYKNVVYIELNEKPTEDYDIINPELVCRPALIK